MSDDTIDFLLVGLAVCVVLAYIEMFKTRGKELGWETIVIMLALIITAFSFIQIIWVDAVDKSYPMLVERHKAKYSGWVKMTGFKDVTYKEWRAMGSPIIKGKSK